MSKKSSHIRLDVELDENSVPESIEWTASDAGLDKPVTCKAMMLAVWDKDDMSSLRMDLWTKEMMVDEMQQFMHQSLLSMADTYEKATGGKNLAEDLRDYCAHFAEKTGILKQSGS